MKLSVFFSAKGLSSFAEMLRAELTVLSVHSMQKKKTLFMGAQERIGKALQIKLVAMSNPDSSFSLPPFPSYSQAFILFPLNM